MVETCVQRIVPPHTATYHAQKGKISKTRITSVSFEREDRGRPMIGWTVITEDNATGAFTDYKRKPSIFGPKCSVGKTTIVTTWTKGHDLTSALKGPCTFHYFDFRVKMESGKTENRLVFSFIVSKLDME
ncbi:hypothetical protein J4Q44_G00353530 [Coregonus suidteri]|uniref:Uncharacterized protein n=1 Tax=Coregonus suidteri TaxID=861788 RepID=A0AAN8KNR2_9TELE